MALLGNDAQTEERHMALPGANELTVSAPTVSLTLFENSGLPLNISHSVLSLFNFSPVCATQWLTYNIQSSNLLIAICILEGLSWSNFTNS